LTAPGFCFARLRVPVAAKAEKAVQKRPWGHETPYLSCFFVFAGLHNAANAVKSELIR
jgi:hypothetical protein